MMLLHVTLGNLGTKPFFISYLVKSKLSMSLMIAVKNDCITYHSLVLQAMAINLFHFVLKIRNKQSVFGV